MSRPTGTHRFRATTLCEKDVQELTRERPDRQRRRGTQAEGLLVFRNRIRIIDSPVHKPQMKMKHESRAPQLRDMYLSD